MAAALLVFHTCIPYMIMMETTQIVWSWKILWIVIIQKCSNKNLLIYVSTIFDSWNIIRRQHHLPLPFEIFRGSSPNPGWKNLLSNNKKSRIAFTHKVLKKNFQSLTIKTPSQGWPAQPHYRMPTSSRGGRQAWSSLASLPNSILPPLAGSLWFPTRQDQNCRE